MNRHKYEGAILALLALIGSSATAMAQDATQPVADAAVQPGVQPAPAAAVQPGVQPAPADASTSGGVGMSAGLTTTPLLDADANAQANAAATQAPVATESPATMEPPSLPPAPPLAVDAANQTDHERVVGGFGVGLLGTATLDNLGYKPITAPIIGLRHWVNDAWGIQAGFGVSHISGTVSNDVIDESNTDDPTAWGFAAHAGVPLALYHDKHYTFLFLPEATFGYSTWRQEDNKNTLVDDGISGRAWLLNVGARAGAEIHFGFMGLPMLTLQGTVGAHLTYRDSGVKSVNEAGTEIERGHYTLGLTTANYNDPWDVFTSSISALYYFK